MERLTKRRIDDGEAYLACVELRKDECDGQCTICWRAGEAVDKLAAYEDTEFSTDASIKLAAQALGTTPERLRELAAADNEGRVLMMPCKFGDKLYRVFGKEIQEFTVSNVKYMGLQHRWSVDTTPFTLYAENLIGTEMFLTREEAERAMEGQKHD